MNKNRPLKSKTIVINLGIILLLFGLTFAPSIYADSIEERIPIKIAGNFNSYESKNFLEISKIELVELENLFDTLHKKLVNAESEDEAYNIFNIGIKELNRYGIISDKDLLILQRMLNEKYLKLRQKSLFLEDNENKFCLTLGKTTNTIIDGIPFRIVASIIDNTESGLLQFFLLPFLILTDLIDDYRPILLNALIYWGAANQGWGGNGWVWTLGINGIKSWEGYFLGKIRTTSTFYTGIVGFTGINIKVNSSSRTNFFLGFARHVKIDYKN